MSLYHLALFVHIIGVLGMFIATAVEFLILGGMHRARTVAQVRGWVSLEAPLGIVFSIMTLLIIVAGVAMILLGQLDWSLAWIDVSFIALILMNVVGPTINARRLKAIHRTATELPDGPVTASLVDQIHDRVLWTSILVLTSMSIGIVYLMTLKPGWLGTSLTTVIALALGFLLSSLLYRRSRASIVAEQKAQQV